MMPSTQVTEYADDDRFLTVGFHLGDHVTFHLICQSQQHNATSAIGSLQVIGCVLVVDPRDAEEDELVFWFEHAYWLSVLQLSHLRGFVLGVAQVHAHDIAHEVLAEAHPELCQLSNPQIAYHRLISLDVTTGEDKWVARDLSSLDPTGMSIP